MQMKIFQWYLLYIHNTRTVSIYNSNQSYLKYHVFHFIYWHSKPDKIDENIDMEYNVCINIMYRFNQYYQLLNEYMHNFI